MSEAQDLDSVSLKDGITLQYGFWAERGIRKFMEDAHVITSSFAASVHPKISVPSYLDAAVFGIFDGHGGRTAADFVQDQLLYEMAVQALDLLKHPQVLQLVVDDTTFNFTDQFVNKWIKKTFNQLNTRLAQDHPHCKDGCTVILAIVPLHAVPPTHVFVACLGDAAAYLGRQSTDFQAIPLSETHKPWVIQEKERILQAGGTVEAGRVNGLLEVSRSIGDLIFKKFGVICTPTLKKFSLQDQLTDAFVVLACDGFWINWTVLEAMQKTRDVLLKEFRKEGSGLTKQTLKTVCQTLVEYVLFEKKSQDNVSVIVLKLHKA